MTQTRMNLIAIVWTAQRFAGFLIGWFVLRPLGLRFDKSHRGQHVMFCHIAANQAANGERPALFIYRMIYRKG